MAGAVRVLDMGSSDLESLVIHRPDEAVDLLIFDPMPGTAQRDQLIRQMLELDGYKILVVQSRDLNEPQAVRTHLRNIAKAIRRNDLAEMIETAGAITTPAVTVEQPSAVETHGTPNRLRRE